MSSAYKILIVDDSGEIASSLSDLLKEMGYEVFTAPGTMEGITMAGEIRPDLILSDVLMPGGGGFALLAAVKSSPDTAEIPVVFLSAVAEKKEIQKGLDAGAGAYIVKPYRSRDLLKVVRMLIEERDFNGQKR